MFIPQCQTWVSFSFRVIMDSVCVCAQPSLKLCLSSSTVLLKPVLSPGLRQITEWMERFEKQRHHFASPCGNVMNRQSYYDFVNTAATHTHARAHKNTHTHTHSKGSLFHIPCDSVWVTQAFGALTYTKLGTYVLNISEARGRTCQSQQKAGVKLLHSWWGHMVLYIRPRREQVDSNSRAAHVQNVYDREKFNHSVTTYAASSKPLPLSDANVFFFLKNTVKNATVVLSAWEVWGGS